MPPIPRSTPTALLSAAIAILSSSIATALAGPPAPHPRHAAPRTSSRGLAGGGITFPGRRPFGYVPNTGHSSTALGGHRLNHRTPSGGAWNSHGICTSTGLSGSRYTRTGFIGGGYHPGISSYSIGRCATPRPAPYPYYGPLPCRYPYYPPAFYDACNYPIFRTYRPVYAISGSAAYVSGGRYVDYRAGPPTYYDPTESNPPPAIEVNAPDDSVDHPLVIRFPPEPDQALDLNRQIGVLLGRGDEAFDRGDYPSARDSYADALELNNRDPGALIALGLAEFALGNFKNAARRIRAGLALFPDLAASSFDLRKVYGRPDDLRSHASALTGRLQAHPDDLETLFLRGFVRWFSGEQAAGLSDLEQYAHSAEADPLVRPFIDAVQETNGRETE